MPKSTRQALAREASKPYEGFPLYPHRSGRWSKKINQRTRYFGPITDTADFGAMAALAVYQAQAGDLHAGREPKLTPAGVTVKQLANAFLAVKDQRQKDGELSERSFADYHATCKRLLDFFGSDREVLTITPVDFERFRTSLAKGAAVSTLSVEIGRVKVLFNYGYKSELLDRPVRYGDGFQKPSQKVLRTARNKTGSMMFEPAEVRKILDAATQPVKAMVLLGANCAFGPTDIANLPLAAVDLKGGWVDFPRVKTGIPRRIPLWLETAAALEEAIAKRPKAKDPADADLCFLTRTRQRWVRVKLTEKNRVVIMDAMGAEFSKLLKALGLAKSRRGFYGLRRGFETVAGEVDQIATDAIMGHAPASNDMAAVYRQKLSDERLRKVTDHVHGWLFPKHQAQ